MNNLWTKEQVAFVKLKHAEGCRPKEIGEAMGKSRAAILGRLFRLGLRSPRPQAETYKVKNRVTGQIFIKHYPKPRPPTASLPHHVNLIDLKNNHCRWPISKDEWGHHMFCGDAVLTKLPYCTIHARIAYSEPNRRWR
jgi:GcrA cell cycle regulator